MYEKMREKPNLTGLILVKVKTAWQKIQKNREKMMCFKDYSLTLQST